MSSEEDGKRYQLLRGRRSGVSAGCTETTFDGTFPNYPKTEEEQRRILGGITNSILFQHLEEEAKRIATAAMFEVSASDGQKIISQGDEGDNFYIIDQGTCEIFVGAKLVKTCHAGDSFGELALMYDAPRAATVVAKGPTRLWALDRRTYKSVMLKSVEEKRALYGKFLAGVDFLQPLSPTERLKVGDFLEPRTYESGQIIVRQGDPGDEFFVIAEGRVACTQSYTDQTDHTEKEGLLCELSVGQYFGEVTLLKGGPRRATVRALEPTKCLVLKAETFNLAMGSLMDYLKRNASLYQTYQEIMQKESETHPN